MTFIFDPNGNHVIQRSIQVLSGFAKADDVDDTDHEETQLTATSLSDQMHFIVDDITKNVEVLSTHRYGCRVVQRAIQHCEGLQKLAVLDKIISCHEKLIIDQYGKRTGLFLLFVTRLFSHLTALSCPQATMSSNKF
jgi:pumilio RNA-binding family